MIKFINNFLSNIFGNTDPEPAKKPPVMRKVSDTSKLTPAQLSLVKDSIRARRHARANGYAFKTKQDMSDDLNKLFRMRKSYSAWNRIFMSIEKELNETPQE